MSVGVDDLARIVHGHCTQPTAKSQGLRIATDSRRVLPGDLFWALSGARYDGHDFLAEAIQRGAFACVVEARRWQNAVSSEVRAQFPAVLVDDTLLALWDYAAWHRQQQSAVVIGVTGSVGKTTTRHLIHGVLQEAGPCFQSPQNFNNQIGVPLSLLGIHSQHEFAVVELAASRGGEIGELAVIARPEIGVLTAIAPAHLQEFGSMAEISRTKGELLEELPAQGLAVINGDDPLVRAEARRARCPVVAVGEASNNDLQATEIEHWHGQLAFSLGRSRFSFPATGRHLLTSALAAVAVAREVGLTDAEITQGLQNFVPLSGRCRPLRIGSWDIIDDTYNANPRSMQAACSTLAAWHTAGKRILILGDMLGLGADSATFHRELGHQAVRSADRLLTIGNHAEDIVCGAQAAGMPSQKYAVCENWDHLMRTLTTWLMPGDVILVKGSRSMKMETVIARLQSLNTTQAHPHREAA